MDQHLRLFIAIDLPETVKQLLHDLQTELRRHTNALRWSDPQGTHLTLKFLGSTRADLVPEIVVAMEQAAAHRQPFELQTAALGVFPNPKRPRVAWLGVAGDVAALSRLQADIERFVAPLGFPTEQRPFNPHLTLGRIVKDPSSMQLASISQAVAQTSVLHSVIFSVGEIVLMRSELHPQGARYTPVAHVPLDGGA
jgi:2'-5' RNA ligase